MGAEEIKPNGISGVIANEHDITHFNNRGTLPRHVMLKCIANGGLAARLLEQSSNKGDIPVCHHVLLVHCVHLQNHAFWEWSAKCDRGAITRAAAMTSSMEMLPLCWMFF